jgi:hypothetical protein
MITTAPCQWVVLFKRIFLFKTFPGHIVNRMQRDVNFYFINHSIYSHPARRFQEKGPSMIMKLLLHCLTLFIKKRLPKVKRNHSKLSFCPNLFHFMLVISPLFKEREMG